MIGNLFDNPDEAAEEQFQEQKSVMYKATKPSHCAGTLDMPPQSRQESNLVGLKNQGATCYLNALFQSHFMVPQFRSAIFALPLCDGTIDKPSEFVTKPKARQLLFEM